MLEVGILLSSRIVEYLNEKSLSDSDKTAKEQFNGHSIVDSVIHNPKENNVDADIVVPVPDSGNAAALGFAQHLKMNYEHGLIRNHYVGRTFIEPSQKIRSLGVKLKLNANKTTVKDKKIILIDDSLVRGTTSPFTVTVTISAVQATDITILVQKIG